MRLSMKSVAFVGGVVLSASVASAQETGNDAVSVQTDGIATTPSDSGKQEVYSPDDGQWYAEQSPEPTYSVTPYFLSPFFVPPDQTLPGYLPNYGSSNWEA